MQVFLESALMRRVDLVCLEDNTQCLGAVKAGCSAALRSLPRAERISLSVAHETFMLTPGNEIRHQPMDTHKGDVFTKRMEPSSRLHSTCWVCVASEATGSAASRATVDFTSFITIIYSYSGQFASTATRASSSTSRNFLCRLQLRGDSRKRRCMPCSL